MECEHPLRHQRTRPHVGDIVCQICRAQVKVYDWELYNSLDRVPEPGSRGSLKPRPQRKCSIEVA